MGSEESEKTASYYTNQYPIGVVDLQHCWNDISRLYTHQKIQSGSLVYSALEIAQVIKYWHETVNFEPHHHNIIV